MPDEFREGCLNIVENRGTIDGRFTNIKRLGRDGGGGCFSLLFSAQDTQTSQEVALKFFRPDKLGESYRWECFQREAAILQELAGQEDIVGWIAPLSTFTQMMKSDTGVPFPINFSYYALELGASDMESAIANATWKPVDILLAFRCMCRGLQRIHCQKIAHRDLKPGNFLITPAGKVKLADFGTARRFDGAEKPLLNIYRYPPGDWLYAAPEILAGLHDVRPDYAFGADFFSLGAILFELFSGTKLGHHLGRHHFHENLCQHFAHVKLERKEMVYDEVIGSIANNNPLPRIAAHGPVIPACIRDRVDELYRRLSMVDYRRRLRDFETIFRGIQSCILILNHEEKYSRWRELQRKFRAAREEKTKRRIVQSRELQERGNRG
jgi:serine/threonine protein kinase